MRINKIVSKPLYPKGWPSNLKAVLYLNSRKGADVWDKHPPQHGAMKPNGF